MILKERERDEGGSILTENRKRRQGTKLNITCLAQPESSY